MKQGTKRVIIWSIVTVLFLIILGIGIFNNDKALPEGLSFEGDIHYTNDVEFLFDLTYKNKAGNTAIEQEIFDEAIQMIKEAEDFIIVDMFLFNDYTDQDDDFPNLSGELTDALIKQRYQHPNMPIVFITDPINTGYHSYETKHLKKLRENNIEVVLTNLDRLRDSNKAYTSVWRLLFRPFNQEGTGWLKNPFADEAPSMTLRSYLELFNVKANHRKVIVTEKEALITSANPHNESGFASNIGFKVSGSILTDIVQAEQAVIDYSGGETTVEIKEERSTTQGDIQVQYVTEGKILKHLVKEINQAEKGDIIWSGMFYLANRSIIDTLHDAADRGVAVRLILDPNKAAFGNQKAGLPNVPIASELIKDKGISIRWYETGEEQYHTKLLYIKKNDKSVVIGGSANYTTRNLDDLNLENNLKVVASSEAPVIQDVDDYFERIWHNEDGIFTASYESNENALTPALRLVYWIQKVTGLTTY